ncbi:PREDICTED: probable sodium/metabolite cotransporter BASS3, chloroplastic [Camelina sativa]|uniref:Probable sodium/metabolite cotransporter BASS3, chloroplastic n=1 Tax=Camelina sativa TaxID=90675 RepID=A0ABM0ZD79_CAMSA|nr:PREDICTED: probable sodium/metabolite cotransporter BASS3, chloroplastic [Camelina sativa]
MTLIASLSLSPLQAIQRQSLSDSNRFKCQFRSSSSCSPLSSLHSSSLSNFLDFRLRRRQGGGLVPVVACSTTPFMGRVGSHWRDGNMSLLSFCGGTDVTERADSSQFWSALLPFVVALTAVAALSYPPSFTWVSKEMYAPALGGIMLSIGIQLSIDDFALAVKRPVPLSVGFVAQYVLKPLLGFLVANAFGMPRTFYAGFVLTCCVAGAQLSSYASSLSKADVAMSILLTSSTTIASVLFTPLLTGLLIGSVVPVDAVAMSKSILQVVLVPVTLGLVLNTYAKPVVTLIQPVMPFVAMVCTSVCIGSPLSINRSQILSAEGLGLIIPIVTFHAVAFVLGYWFSKIPGLRQEEEVSRTISLCTGMQSSTLAGLLASQFLGSSQAVPAACSVVVMAIMGLCLASFWGNGFRIRDILSLSTPQSSGYTAES